MGSTITYRLISCGSLSVFCVCSLSLPSLFSQSPKQSTALCTSIDAALAHLSSSDFSGEPGHGLNETALKLVIVHFLLAHPGTPSLFTLLPCPPEPPGHISHPCGVARVTIIISEMPVAVQPPDSGGHRHRYPHLCFTWRQRPPLWLS
jgi:hypothetical protein